MSLDVISLLRTKQDDKCKVVECKDSLDGAGIGLCFLSEVISLYLTKR